MATKKVKKNDSDDLSKIKTSVKKAKAKKAVVKKAVPKKKIKEVSIKKAEPATREIIIPEVEGIPCICIKVKKRWFCMKKEDGALVQCDGPFATKEECEAHVCIDA